jgi:hypothetical protein
MFVINDQDHPQISEIHAELKRQSMQMHDGGYVPDTKFVLHDVEEEEVFRLHHRTRNWPLHLGSSAHSWYSYLYLQESANMSGMPHFHQVYFKDS